MSLLSVQDYARSRKRSRAGIYKAIREGRLKAAVVLNDGGKVRLDVDLADVEFARNSDPAFVRDADSIRAGIDANRDPSAGPLFQDEPAAAEQDPADDGDQPEASSADSKSSSSLAGSRAAIAAFDARLRKLDYEERLGRLIPADELRTQLFRTNRMVRDALLAVPDKVAGTIAGIKDEHRVREILMKSISNALRNLSDQFGRKS